MILSGELRARREADRGRARRPPRRLARARCARPSACSRKPGLVRTEKNRGVFVRDLPIEEAIEIFDLRAAMDELVGRRLAATHHAGRS